MTVDELIKLLFQSCHDQIRLNRLLSSCDSPDSNSDNSGSNVLWHADSVKTRLMRLIKAWQMNNPRDFLNNETRRLLLEILQILDDTTSINEPLLVHYSISASAPNILPFFLQPIPTFPRLSAAERVPVLPTEQRRELFMSFDLLSIPATKIAKQMTQGMIVSFFHALVQITRSLFIDIKT
jgi:hypothetical protein